MIKGYKKSLFILTALIVIVFLFIFIVCTQMKLNDLINNNHYYEAYEYIVSSHNTESEIHKNPSIQFYDVMANHYEADIIGEGGWILPDFSGWSCAEIAYALHNIGQTYEIEFVKDGTFGVNEVVEQIPKPGVKIDRDQKIHLYVNDLDSSERIIRYDFNNYKTIVEYGEWAYFAHGNIIYKARIDGKEASVFLETEYRIESFFFKENSVYYVGYDTTKEKSGLYFIDIESNESELIYDLDYFRTMQNFGDIIFTIMTQYNIETKQISKVDYVNYINFNKLEYFMDVKNNVVYYLEETSGNKKEIFKSDNRILFIYLDRDKIYYIYEKTKEVSDERVAFLAVYDMDKQQTTTLGKLYSDIAPYPIIVNMNVWRENLIITCLDASTIIYDLELKRISKVNKSFLDITQYEPSYKATCGNYVYEGDNGFKYRYNLLTNKYEELMLIKVK